MPHIHILHMTFVWSSGEYETLHIMIETRRQGQYEGHTSMAPNHMGE